MNTDAIPEEGAIPSLEGCSVAADRGARASFPLALRFIRKTSNRGVCLRYLSCIFALENVAGFLLPQILLFDVLMKRYKMRSTKKQGFTLVELLVVIAIIGIWSGYCSRRYRLIAKQLDG